MLHAQVRANVDEAKATLVDLRGRLQKYTGPFELPEPGEELRATVRHIRFYSIRTRLVAERSLIE